MIEKTFSGGCQCGQVAYEVTCETLVAYICHCNECQRQTASAFAISVPIEMDGLRITGELSSYDRPAHSGATTKCFFCSSCGTDEGLSSVFEVSRADNPEGWDNG